MDLNRSAQGILLQERDHLVGAVIYSNEWPYPEKLLARWAGAAPRPLDPGTTTRQ